MTKTRGVKLRATNKQNEQLDVERIRPKFDLLGSQVLYSEKTKILIISALPKQNPLLNVAQEVNQIREVWKSSKFRDRVEIVYEPAMQTRQLQDHLQYHSPTILHFAGHGQTNGILVEDSAGDQQLISTYALISTLRLYRQEGLRCVVLNACYTETLARELASEIGCALGMISAIGDNSAIKFARGFYRAICNGKDIEFAFRSGCVEVDLESLPHTNRPKLRYAIEPTMLQLVAQSPAQDAMNTPSLTLSPPIGAVRLNDPFYIEREVDDKLQESIAARGVIVTVRGPRQSGRTSLLIRGENHANSNNIKVVSLNMQDIIERNSEWSIDKLLYQVAQAFIEELELDDSILQENWQLSVAPKRKFTRVVQEVLRHHTDNILLLVLDEVDVLVETGHHTEFFSLLRSWNNRAARGGIWAMLNIVLSISTEPHLLIADQNQSPFNVGLALPLRDFTEEEVMKLNVLYGTPLKTNELDQMMKLLNGHPYLVRLSMYEIVKNDIQWHDFVQRPWETSAMIADHLIRIGERVLDNSAHKKALSQILKFENVRDEMSLFWLERAGVLKVVSADYQFRCGLYRHYFESIL